MRMNRFFFFSATAVLGLVASLAGGDRVCADTLVLGGPYPTFSWNLSLSNGFSESGTLGSGSIANATLNGVALPWVYCIDIPDNVNVPGTYSNTTVTTNGSAWFGATNPWVTSPTGNPLGKVTTVGGSAAVAGEIAYVLANHANTATTATEQEEVQAAIWKLIYNQGGSTHFTVSDSTINTVSNTYVAAALGQTGPVSSFLWMSPGGSGNQALVTAVPVPEPSTLAIASLCGAGFVFYGLRRRKATGA